MAGDFGGALYLLECLLPFFRKRLEGGELGNFTQEVVQNATEEVAVLSEVV